MKDKKWFWMLLIFCVFMSASIVITLVKTNGLIRDAFENDLRVESRMIANSVNSTFLRPLTVSETMSKDKPMREILSSSTLEESVQQEEAAAEYLRIIKDGFGYTMVFAINDRFGTYYTYDGISKYIDAQKNESDEWYSVFVNRQGDKIYKLDVDTDEENNWALSVFINTEVKDSEGHFIGCCGVGVEMTELQRQIERFERIYGVKINLIDETGLIQIDSDAQRIERDCIDIEHLSEYSDGECYYEIGNGSARTIIYLDSLEWYLVVENLTPINQDMLSLILPNILFMGFGILVMVFFMVWEWKENNKSVK